MSDESKKEIFDRLAEATPYTPAAKPAEACAHDKGWNSYLDKGEFVFVCSHCGIRRVTA